MAHMYISSDFVIITLWKRNKVSGKTNLVASKVFGFGEFTLEDVADTTEFINAFRINGVNESLFYRCEFQEEKDQIFIDVRNVQEKNKKSSESSNDL